MAGILERYGSQLPDYLKEIKLCKYQDNADLTEDFCLYRKGYNDKDYPIVAEGEIIGIIGKKKSRKTLFAHCLVAAMTSQNPNHNLGFRWKLPPGSRALVLDTEQPKTRFHRAIRRLKFMMGVQESLDAYAVRAYGYIERLEQLQYMLELGAAHNRNYKVVLIDGIVDLAPNENDDYAVFLAQQIMEITDKYKVVVIYVQHTNRGGVVSNGKLGSTFDKKLDSQFLVEFDDESQITTVTNPASREEGIASFSFCQDSQGFPKLLT